MATKIEYLMAIFEQQQASGPLMFAAHAHVNSGRLREASTTYTQLAAILERLIALHEQHNAEFPDSPMEIASIAGQLVNALRSHADVLDALNDRAGANALRAKAAGTAKYLAQDSRADQRRQEAAALIARGRYHEAIVALGDARELFAGGNDVLGAAQTGAQLAEIYQWLGDTRRAREEAERAAKLLEPHLPSGGPSMEGILGALVGGDLQAGLDRTRVLQTWLELVQLDGRLSRVLRDFDHARRQFERALPHIPQVARVGILFQLARIEVEGGDVAQGYQMLRELEPGFTGIVAQRIGALWAWQAEALLRLQRAAEALALAERATTELAKRGDLDMVWQTQWCAARACLALDRKRDAFRSLIAATETIASLRRAPLGVRLDSTYLADKLPVYERAIELAVQLGEAAAACRAIEGIKSRGLTAILATARIDEAAADDPNARRLAELSKRIDDNEYAAMRDGWTTTSAAQHQKLLAERFAVIEQIRIADPRWRSMSAARELDVAKLQSRLGAHDRAAVTLHHSGNRVVAVLVTGTECKADTRVLSEQTVNALEAYRRHLRSPSRVQKAFDPANVPGLDAAALLPTGLLDRALEARSVVIVPHGVLHVIPWGSLRYRERRLFEHRPVGIAPNLGCIGLPRRETASAPRVALLGAPDYSEHHKTPELEFGPEELRAVGKAYGSARLGDLVERENATCAAFRTLANRPDAAGAVLHVNCHGEFVTGEPMSSSLVLTDGNVDAAEIVTYKMQYDEVVLSACSTGYRPTSIGDIELTGDDIVGLVAAFLEAGVGTVVVSIPPAREDAAQAFMAAYHALRVKAPAIDALAGAQKATLQANKYEPYLWAGYTVYTCQLG